MTHPPDFVEIGPGVFLSDERRCLVLNVSEMDPLQNGLGLDEIHKAAVEYGKEIMKGGGCLYDLAGNVRGLVRRVIVVRSGCSTEDATNQLGE